LERGIDIGMAYKRGVKKLVASRKWKRVIYQPVVSRR
jgi:hypothetical protein